MQDTALSQCLPDVWIVQFTVIIRAGSNPYVSLFLTIIDFFGLIHCGFVMYLMSSLRNTDVFLVEIIIPV